MRLVDCPNCFSSHSDEWDQSESVKEFATVSYYNTKSVPSKAAQQQQQRPSSKTTNTFRRQFRQFAKVIFGKHHHHQKNTIYGNPGSAYKRYNASTATSAVSTAVNSRPTTATFSRRKNIVERKHKIKKRDLVRKSRQKGTTIYTYNWIFSFS